MSFLYPASVVDHDTIVLGPRCLSNNNLAPDRYFGFCKGVSFSEERTAMAQVDVAFKIYVSFGSMCDRYPLAIKIIREIISALGGNSKFLLYVSAGANIGELKTLERGNIVICDFFNQISILNEVDLAIIHGGYGTVKDCIINKIPMILIPFYYDQYQTARKIQDYGLGIAIDAKFFNEKNFLNSITRLISDECYVKNMTNFYSEEHDEKEFENAFQHLIESL